MRGAYWQVGDLVRHVGTGEHCRVLEISERRFSDGSRELRVGPDRWWNSTKVRVVDRHVDMSPFQVGDRVRHVHSNRIGTVQEVLEVFEGGIGVRVTTIDSPTSGVWWFASDAVPYPKE